MSINTTKNKDREIRFECSDYLEKEGLSVEDQRWIWDNVPHVTYKEGVNSNVSVNGNENDTYKNGVKTKLTVDKHRAIALLKKCNYRTSPKKTASLLEILFRDCEAKEGHWLYVAQHYAPRQINWLIARMVKQHQLGEISIVNAAKYFTEELKHREKRKHLRSKHPTNRYNNEN